jgi:hypothetical protein
MTSSIFILLADAIEARLRVDPPVAAVIQRDRFRPFGADQASAVVIKIDKTQGSRTGPADGPTDWGTLYSIECYARCAANVLPSVAVDPIVSAVYERLSVSAESLALDVEDLLPDPHIEWDLTETAEGLGSAAIGVRIVHRTQSAQLVPWS